MNPNLVSTERYEEICNEFDRNLILEVKEEVVEADDDGGDFEFFVGGGDPTSPISADDIFQNGQIRPLFPFSDEHAGNSEEATTSYGPPVRKVFVMSSLAPDHNDDVAEGSYCAWSSEKSPANTLDPTPEMSRKSNSTGLSKLWRVRDSMARSHSDGKDAFVFLTRKSDEKVRTASLPEKKKENIPKIKVGRGAETAPYSEKKGKPSAYEVYYGKKEKKAGKSYLPYRQNLVGFFTNANGMSRNVHPY